MMILKRLRGRLGVGWPFSVLQSSSIERGLIFVKLLIPSVTPSVFAKDRQKVNRLKLDKVVEMSFTPTWCLEDH